MSATQQDAPPPPYHRRNSNHDLQVPMSDVERMSMEDESRPLPDGWIRQFDPGSAHHFYVDTRGTPPRSIWVHPLDDEQYRRENNLPPLSPRPPPSPKGGSPSRLPQDEKAKLRDDEKSAAATSSSSAGAGPSTQQTKGKEHDRGFFGKMKDNIIGTKEEREERKRRKAEEEERMQREYLERRRILMEQARLHDQQRRQYYALNGPLGRAGYQYGSSYAPPPGVYARRRGGVGLPLLGGLAGGLLLADALDGPDFGGGFGGGGFDGGGFDGGGDFGGF
ncbi:hypothetical protein FS837_004413 [Tulasnella sp. UAMH 9824]|nr:hypothetical protein FS837_004413 [Tulasnella sp. UAMH 9824]